MSMFLPPPLLSAPCRVFHLRRRVTPLTSHRKFRPKLHRRPLRLSPCRRSPSPPNHAPTKSRPSQLCRHRDPPSVLGSSARAMPSSSRIAEIEVVVADGGARKGAAGEQKQPGGAEPDPVVDVYSAAAYGDLDRLRRFVERGGGAGSLSAPDGSGYHAVQWAALNSYPHVALYIVEHGGDANAEDLAQQTALHWAAVRGATSVADVLLESGARLEAADVNGYRDYMERCLHPAISWINLGVAPSRSAAPG